MCLVPETELIGIQRPELRAAAVAQLDNLFGQAHGTVTSVGPVRAFDGFNTEISTEVPDNLAFRVGITGEAIDRDDDRHAEFAKIADMATEVFAPGLQRSDILSRQLCLRHTAVHL